MKIITLESLRGYIRALKQTKTILDIVGYLEEEIRKLKDENTHENRKQLEIYYRVYNEILPLAVAYERWENY